MHCREGQFCTVEIFWTVQICPVETNFFSTTGVFLGLFFADQFSVENHVQTIFTEPIEVGFVSAPAVSLYPAQFFQLFEGPFDSIDRAADLAGDPLHGWMRLAGPVVQVLHKSEADPVFGWTEPSVARHGVKHTQFPRRERSLGLVVLFHCQMFLYLLAGSPDATWPCSQRCFGDLHQIRNMPFQSGSLCQEARATCLLNKLYCGARAASLRYRDLLSVYSAASRSAPHAASGSLRSHSGRESRHASASGRVTIDRRPTFRSRIFPVLTSL